MSDNQIIIIGAGAAGLMAAAILSKEGRKVVVLEARDRIGGRIHTLYDEGFAMPVELGAEFVHGDLPVTLDLLKEAGITYSKTDGEWWQVKGDELEEDAQVIDHWKEFHKKAKSLHADMTLDQFLEAYFSDGEYAKLRESARHYAAGFDTADPARASVITLNNEWAEEDHANSYNPAGGYGQMVNYLAAKCRAQGCDIHLGQAVKDIKWQKDSVTVTTQGGQPFDAAKVVITAPLGVLQLTDGEQGAISLTPELPGVRQAISQLGMGNIIKVLLQFSTPFWESKETEARVGKDLDELGFLFSQEKIPTWWTLYPRRTTLLTGWLGGPNSLALSGHTDEELLFLAIDCLASIFKLPAEELKGMLTNWRVANWNNEVYSRGSYTYPTVYTKEAQKVLRDGIAETIYFAGEGLDDGDSIGTVEAALRSGRDVADRINS